MDSQNNGWFRIGTPQCGALLALCGVAIAFMLFFLGFWRTLIVAALAALGFWLGGCNGKIDLLKGFINKMFPPKGE